METLLEGIETMTSESEYQHEARLFYYFVKGALKGKIRARPSTTLKIIKKEFDRIEKLNKEPT